MIIINLIIYITIIFLAKIDFFKLTKINYNRFNYIIKLIIYELFYRL